MCILQVYHYATTRRVGLFPLISEMQLAERLHVFYTLLKLYLYPQNCFRMTGFPEFYINFLIWHELFLIQTYLEIPIPNLSSVCSSTF